MTVYLLCATDSRLEACLAKHFRETGIEISGSGDASRLSLPEINAEMLGALGVKTWYKQHADTFSLDSAWAHRAKLAFSRMSSRREWAWADSSALATADFWMELDDRVNIVFLYDDAAAFLSRQLVGIPDLGPGSIREQLKQRHAVLEVADLVKDRFPDRVHLVQAGGRDWEVGTTVFLRSSSEGTDVPLAIDLRIDPIKRALCGLLLQSDDFRIVRSGNLRWVSEAGFRASGDSAAMAAMLDYFNCQDVLGRALVEFESVSPGTKVATQPTGMANFAGGLAHLLSELDARVLRGKSNSPGPIESQTESGYCDLQSTAVDDPLLAVQELKEELSVLGSNIRAVRAEMQTGLSSVLSSTSDVKSSLREMAEQVAAVSELETHPGKTAPSTPHKGIDSSEQFRAMMKGLHDLAVRVQVSLRDSEALLNSDAERTILERQVGVLEKELAAARRLAVFAAQGRAFEESSALAEFWRQHQPEDFWLDLRREFPGRNWYSSEPDGRWMGPGLIGEVVLPQLKAGIYRFELEVVDAMSDSCLQSFQMGLGREFSRPELIPVVPGAALPVIMCFSVEVEGKFEARPPVLLLSTADAFRPSDRGMEDSRLLSVKCKTLRVQFCGGG